MIYLDYAANHPADPGWWSGFAARSWPFPATPTPPTRRGGPPRGGAGPGSPRPLPLCWGRSPEEVIYTSGATESNNLAIKGLAQASRHVGRHILSTQLEHSSVGGSLTALQNQGYEIDLLDVDRRGQVDLEQLRDLLRKDTVLLSLSAVDSELGTVGP